MSNKATYLGALMDAGIRALGIVGGASIGRSLGGGRMLPTALGGVIGHDAASGLLQRMGRNQYVSVGRRGVKPAKVKKQIIMNEEDNMSRSLTESLINEGIRALQELQTAGGGAAGSRTGGPVAGPRGGLAGKRLGGLAGKPQSLRSKLRDIVRGQQPMSVPGGGSIPGRTRGQMIGDFTRPRRDRGMRKAGPLSGSPLTLRDF